MWHCLAQRYLSSTVGGDWFGIIMLREFLDKWFYLGASRVWYFSFLDVLYTYNPFIAITDRGLIRVATVLKFNTCTDKNFKCQVCHFVLPDIILYVIDILEKWSEVRLLPSPLFTNKIMVQSFNLSLIHLHE